MVLNSQPITVKPCAALAKIRLLSCDVDGVMTDGGLYYSAEGTELRRFHVHDGLGLQHLKKAGIEIAILSHSSTPAIIHRAQRLGIPHCFTQVDNKVACLKQLLLQLNIELKQVAHIGDDLNDLELLKTVGIPITVANAVPEVMAHCQLITQKSGGMGAVREVTDAILASLLLV
jgi:3-deoxy-D-manno-octulosonate 8-phosphate phosphatase (KDO 8-P phosphatase)